MASENGADVRKDKTCLSRGHRLTCYLEQKNRHVIWVRQRMNKRYSLLKGQALQGTNEREDLREREGNLNPLLNSWY